MYKPLAVSGLFICMSLASSAVYADAQNNLLFPTTTNSAAAGYQQVDDANSSNYGREQTFYPGDQGYQQPEINSTSPNAIATAQNAAVNNHITNDFHQVNAFQPVTVKAKNPAFVIAAPVAVTQSSSVASARIANTKLSKPLPTAVNQSNTSTNNLEFKPTPTAFVTLDQIPQPQITKTKSLQASVKPKQQKLKIIKLSTPPPAINVANRRGRPVYKALPQPLSQPSYVSVNSPLDQMTVTKSIIIQQPSRADKAVSPKDSSPSLTSKIVHNVSSIKFSGFVNYIGTFLLKLKSMDYPIPGIGKLPRDVDIDMVSSANAGIALTSPITDSWSIGTKLLVKGKSFGDTKDFNFEMPTLYVKYKSNLNTYTAGRFEFPGLLYSRTMNISDNYPFVFLPSEVYSLVPLDSINGLEYTYKDNMFDNGQFGLETNLYAGVGKYDIDLGGTPSTVLNTKYNRIFGASISLTHQQALRFNLSYTHVGFSGDRIYDNVSHSLSGLNSQVLTAGLNANFKILNFTAEYIQRKMPSEYASQQGYYTTFSTQIGGFEPSFTMAHFDTLNTPTAGYGVVQKQTSYTLGFKLSITKYIDSKLSFTHIKPEGGTNGLGVASDEKDNLVALSISGEFSNEDINEKPKKQNNQQAYQSI